MESLPLHPYDIAMLVIIVGVTLFGMLKGMAWQVASLGSLVISSLVAMRFGPDLAPRISNQAPWNRFLAMLILFVATSLAIWVIFRMVAGMIDRVKLKEFDRQLGALFGFVKGVLFCVVVTFFAVTLSETSRQVVLKARSGYYVAVLVRDATPILPKEVRDVLGKYLDEMNRKLDPNTPAEPASKSPTTTTLKEAARALGEKVEKATGSGAAPPSPAPTSPGLVPVAPRGGGAAGTGR